MRSLVSKLAVSLGLLVSVAPAQTTFKATTGACTGGLCRQQVSCPAGQTTSISGTVYAPNGVDPLPNVVVYIPTTPVDPFTAGVSCPVVGAPPSGTPLVGTTTAVDGTFTLTDVPAGTNIPLVIQTGRWRRQLVVPGTTACGDTSFSTRLPRNQSEGDIPKFAIATGAQDQVECVLRKVGIDDSEFTNPGGTGRVNLFSGSGDAGALIDANTPSQKALMTDKATLEMYDVLMLPCQGAAFVQDQTSLANFEDFANVGGRVYSSHFSYVWLYNNPPFNEVANWQVGGATLPNGIATIDQSFAEGKTLAQWLQLTGASTTVGQIPINTLKHDFNGVVAPNQSWMTLNNASYGNPVMQFVFDTPWKQATNQCGKVLFNEYHVESPLASPTGKAFPTECTSTTYTAQEKLLEYSIFELTNDGSPATLTPNSADFGTEPLGFTTATQPFVWTNLSTFPASVSLVNTTGDFSVSSSNCQVVPAGASCTINVAFSPTVLGMRTGTLSVGSGATTLVATLTGVGIPALTISLTDLNFGSLDVGASATRTLMVTNQASGSVPFPALTATGDFSVSSTCGAAVQALSTCNINVTFKPTVFGPRTGTLSVNSSAAVYTGISSALMGNGLDFTIGMTPASGQVIAGHQVTTGAATTPLAGFAAPLSLSCTTTAPGSTCMVTPGTFTSSDAATTSVTITTTSEYTVIGYSGVWWLAGLGSGLMLLLVRRRNFSSGAGGMVRGGLLVLLLAAAGLGATGCSGKLPAENVPYTKAGSYTYTVTATDGFLVHSATYSLNVTAK